MFHHHSPQCFCPFQQIHPVAPFDCTVLTSAESGSLIEATAELRDQHILACSLHADVDDARPQILDTQSSTSPGARKLPIQHQEVGLHLGIFINMLLPNLGGFLTTTFFLDKAFINSESDSSSDMRLLHSK